MLNARPLWVRLLFRALGRFIPTTGAVFHLIENDSPVSESELGDADGWKLSPVKLPRRSFGRMAPVYAPWIRRQLQQELGHPAVTIFTQPCQRSLCRYFADTKRVYYVADDYRWGYGWDPKAVEAWEKTIVENVERVVCVSNALAHSFQKRLYVSERRMHVSASGMPAGAIPESSSANPEAPRLEIFADRKPVAGVLGTIDSRIRLDWLRSLIDALPWLNLLLVGPIARLGEHQLDDWRYLQDHPRCVAIGKVGYFELFQYAAAIDVGLIPFTDEGINPASSPTRFYTQLPFGQPIVASESSLQLREFEPLVSIARTLPEFIRRVEELHLAEFDDGLASERHATAYEHTWEKRAETFYRELIAG